MIDVLYQSEQNLILLTAISTITISFKGCLSITENCQFYTVKAKATFSSCYIFIYGKLVFRIRKCFGNTTIYSFSLKYFKLNRVKVLLQVRDVTHRDYIKGLRQSLKAKSNSINFVRHEFRTPLIQIMQYLSVLIDEIPKIKIGKFNLKEVIDDCLDMFKLHANEYYVYCYRKAMGQLFLLIKIPFIVQQRVYFINGNFNLYLIILILSISLVFHFRILSRIRFDSVDLKSSSSLMFLFLRFLQLLLFFLLIAQSLLFDCHPPKNSIYQVFLELLFKQIAK